MIQKKYKIGDKVIIRKDLNYPNYIREALKKIDYIVTIDRDIITNNEEYCFEEIPGAWKEKAIVVQYYTPVPIYSRFDILDL